jgi:EmrB/QacA subfamily drug resistance transporter
MQSGAEIFFHNSIAPVAHHSQTSTMSATQDPSPLDVVHHTLADFPANPVELVDDDDELFRHLEKQTTEPVTFSALRKTKTSDSQITTMPFKQLWIILVGLAFAIFLSSLNQTMVSTVLPVVASEFKALDLAAWIATAYLLTSTVTQPIAGKLSDIFGRKVLMLFSLVMFLIGTALCAASVNMLMLIISRATQGIGGGMLIAMVQIILADVVSLKDRGKYTGFIGAVWTVSSIVGPLLGGVFADKLSWRWAFWINLPFGALALLIILFFLRLPGESFIGTRVSTEGVRLGAKLRKIDYLGTLLLVVSTSGILLATSWGGNTFAWNSPVIIALYSSSGAVLLLFILVEVFVASDPLIPPRLFKVRNVSLVCLYSFLVGMTMFTLIFYIPIYFQISKGSSAMQSGLEMLPLLISTIVFSIVSGILITRTGMYRIFVVLGAAFVAVGCGLMSTWNLKSNRGHEIGYMTIAGAGLGFTLQAAVIAAQAAIRHRDLAVTTSLVGFARTIGGVIGVAVCSALFNNRAATVLARNLAGIEGITPQVLEALRRDPKFLVKLPAALHPLVLDAYVQALNLIFLIGVPLAGAAFLLSLGLKHHPIKAKNAPIPAKE